MNKNYVDFGHFLSLLSDKLPRSGYRATSYNALRALITAAKAAQEAVLLHERHSDDVPDATGLNIFLPASDSAWSKKSKLYNQLYGYKDWNFLVGYIYGRRSGAITDSFLASDSLSWKSAIALVESDSGGVTVSRYLSEITKARAVSASLRYGAPHRWCERARTHTHAQTHTHTLCTNTRTLTHARSHEHTHARLHTHTHARTHARARARTHTFTHTHTHTYRTSPS